MKFGVKYLCGHECQRPSVQNKPKRKQEKKKKNYDWGIHFTLPSDTKLLLMKNYSEIIAFKNYEFHAQFCESQSFFPGDFEGANPSQIPENNSQGILFSQTCRVRGSSVNLGGHRSGTFHCKRRCYLCNALLKRKTLKFAHLICSTPPKSGGHAVPTKRLLSKKNAPFILFVLMSGGRGCLGEGRLGVQVLAVFSFIP